jgi:hypothetical protein
MRNNIYRYVLFIIVILFPSAIKSQFSYYYQWGLLPDNIIDYFIGESSGERAFNHITVLSEYNRQRTLSEFSGTLMESQYVIDKLKEYGLSDVIRENKFLERNSRNPVGGKS